MFSTFWDSSGLELVRDFVRKINFSSCITRSNKVVTTISANIYRSVDVQCCASLYICILSGSSVSRVCANSVGTLGSHLIRSIYQDLVVYHRLLLLSNRLYPANCLNSFVPNLNSICYYAVIVSITHCHYRSY